MTTQPSDTPTAEDLMSLAYMQVWLSAILSTIKRTADNAREDARMNGHHCDMRRALDSISSRATQDLESIAKTGQAYRTHELLRIETLERENADLLKLAEGMADALEEAKNVFRGYEFDHFKTGKIEKAVKNQRHGNKCHEPWADFRAKYPTNNEV